MNNVNVSNLPNFMIIGAAKSGTTSLAYYLSQHPDVYIPKEKETLFFSFDQLYAKGIEFYSRMYFSGASSYAARADATPAYLHRHDLVIPRIKADLGSDLRFIVLLRDPVRRAWSHYLHQLRNVRESLSFEEALEKEDERHRLDPDGWFGYFRDGEYSEQLKVWFDAFGRSSFLILKQSDLAAHPQATLDSVFRFIDVKPWEVTDLSIKNQSSVPRSRLLMKVTSADFPGREWLKSRLPPNWRRAVLVWLRGRNTKVADKSELPTLNPPTERRLRHRYATEIDSLEALLGQSFAEWKADDEAA